MTAKDATRLKRAFDLVEEGVALLRDMRQELREIAQGKEPEVPVIKRQVEEEDQ